ncbi:MAG: metalloendopeptidase [Pseudobdellovibrio sp.]
MADLTKDPLEEFEFRPINEGLGFHRKNKAATSSFEMGTGAQTTNQNFTVRPATTPTISQNTQINASLNSPGTSFSAPLPRSTYNAPSATKQNFNIPTVEDDSIAKAQNAVNEILKNLNHKRQMDFASETERMNYDLKKSRPLFFAAGLDAMLIVAAFLMSMIAMLSITKVDLFLNLSHPETSGLIYVATGLLFISVAFIYMVVNRAFVGYTPGEWAFDQRCGRESDMQNLMYIPRVVFRSLIVIGTGFITMQLLSYLFNKDVAGQISGVTMFRKPNA